MPLDPAKQQLCEKQRISPEMCETELDGVSELMDLLRMDLEADGEEGKAGRRDAACSVRANTDPAQFTKRVMKAITKERLAAARSTGQLRRLYGSNKKATRPFHLFLTDLKEDGRLYRECVRMNDGFLSYTVIIVPIHHSLINTLP
ncbi:hypothetical protein GOODEAATRI_012087 [Goodea atripinnis]|uniref:Uncharacterized protein n=1 Tax=Goodea atripinnis TaxID=208336 RepID=A0ABV0P3P7_9TELE